MTFAISEEQQLLADNLRRLLAESNEFEVRRRRLCGAPPDRLALWPQLAEMGIIGAAFDEAHGGFGGDPRTTAVVLFELGISLAVEPFLAAPVMAGRILQHCTNSWASELIAALISGSSVCVLAHDAGSDPFADPGVLARRDSGGVTLSGQVRCVHRADIANGFLISAMSDSSIAIYYVPRNAEGLLIETYRLIDDAGAADLTMHELRLAADALLTFDTSAKEVLDDALEWGLLGLCAETAGIVSALNRATFSYLTTRKQFGVPLASFQALQHRAADMHIAAEEIFAAVESAIDALQTPPSAARSAALAACKVVADVGGRRVGHEAVQMHGGMGVSDELNVSHYARRLAAIRTELGGADVHRLRFGAAA